MSGPNTPQWQRDLAEVLVGCGNLRKAQRILEGINGMRDCLRVALPIVKTAFLDHHINSTTKNTFGFRPMHHAYRKIDEVFGCETFSRYQNWENKVLELDHINEKL